MGTGGRRARRRARGLRLQLLRRVGHGRRDLLQLLVRVHRRDGRADQVLARGHRGRRRHDGEDALLQEGLPERVDALLRAEDDRDGRRLALPGVEPEALQHRAVLLRVGPELLEVLRLRLHDLERGLGAGGLARADRGAEDRLLGMRAQELDHVLGGGDEAARAGERLGKAAADHVDAVVESSNCVIYISWFRSYCSARISILSGG